MAHAKPDTSIPCLNFEYRHSGRLKHIMTKWIQTHKSVLMGLQIISCIVTARTSLPNVSRRCFERLVSVYRLRLVALTSRSRLNAVTLTSRSRLGLVTQKSWSRLSLETLTSRSRHHMCHLQPCFVGLCAIAVWPIDFI